jgi:hypothetical protein
MSVNAVSLRRRPQRFEVAALIVFLGLVDVGSLAHAREELGSFGNALIENPHADPGDKPFGSHLVSGDFDGDGIDDLAIAETFGTRVRVHLGSPWTVSDGLAPIAAAGTTVTTPFHNGELAAGDFDNDGRDELVLGAAGVNNAAGAAYVLDRAVNGTWTVQETIEAAGAYPGAAQPDAQLGHSFAVGDFDNDGFDDLAIGMIGQTVGGFANAGAVMVTYGTATGITSTGAQVFNRSNDGLAFAPREDDLFGYALAAGDFDDDGIEELAIGVRAATCPNGTSRAGAVVVMVGIDSIGVSSSDTRIWRPGTLGIGGDCASTSGFGSTLAEGDVDGEGTRDLVIGAPLTGNGFVHIIYGVFQEGLSAAGNQRFSAPSAPGLSTSNSRFGNVLATGKLRDCQNCISKSLVVGAPFTDVNGAVDAGAVWVFYTEDGMPPNAAAAKLFVASAELGTGVAHTDDRFGSSLAVGDFNDDSNLLDLAIGIPQFEDGGVDEGAVQLLFQSDLLIFADGFE